MNHYKQAYNNATGEGDQPMTPQERATWEFQRKQTLKVNEARESEKARQWLQDRGIVGKNVTGEERRKALQKYIKTLVKVKPGKDWADQIIEDFEAGRYPHENGYRLACDAKGKEPVKIEGVAF